MSARQKQIMEEYVARLEYQLEKALERCHNAEAKLTYVSRLVTYGIEHPPSRYMCDASGATQQPSMPVYHPPRSIENIKRAVPYVNNQIVQPQQSLPLSQPLPQTNTHIFFE